MAIGVGTAIKAAGIVIHNKDKIGKILGIAAIGITIPFVLLVTSFMSLVSAFIPDGAIPSEQGKAPSETAIYKAVSEITEEYFSSMKTQMEKEKQKLIESNTIIKMVTNADGQIITEKQCNMTITSRFNYFGTAYLISYLQYSGNLIIDTAEINQDEAQKFMNEIGKIEIHEISENEFEISNVYLTVDEIAEKYFVENTDKKKFKASCEAYGAFFSVNESDVAKDVISINEGGGHVNLLEIPLYLQYSGRWASSPYGNGTIAKNGCAPTCLAMLLSYFKQQVIYPDVVTAWTGNRYYVPGAGSSWEIFSAVSEHWDIGCSNIGKSQKSMIKALSEGKPVIASMAPGTFTKGGHFIILTGITESGKIKVNDPNDNIIKNHKDREFEVSLIMRESKNFWSFEK